MKPQINATRMEFFKLRRRLSTAVRGHKLLKDKNEGLMREFFVPDKGLQRSTSEALMRVYPNV